MNTKHTPGPWILDRPMDSQAHYAWNVFRADGHMDFIASVGPLMVPGSKGTAEQAANAQLIAASPRMYDYLVMRAALCDNEAIQILKEIGYAESETPKGRTAGYMGPRE